MDYYEGSNGKPWDINKAYQYFVKAGNQGCALAQYRLGCMFSNGAGVAENREKAIYWFEKAVENEHLDSMVYLYYIYYDPFLVDEILVERGLMLLKHAAENGHVKAQNSLGTHYLDSSYELKCYIHNLDTDSTKEYVTQKMYWYQQAAKEGYLEARWAADKFAWIGFPEEGVEFLSHNSIRDADRWWKYPCDYSEYSKAQRQNYDQMRLTWFKNRAEEGESIAQYALGEEYENLITMYGQSSIWAEQALFWYGKAAEQGLAMAQRSLSQFYRGMGLRKRTPFQPGEILFIEPSQFYKGVCLISEKDLQKSLYWSRKASEQGAAVGYFSTILAFNATDRDDAPKFTFEELEHYRLTNHDSI